QRLAELRLVDDARAPSGEEIGALERGVIELVEVGGGEDDASCRVAPGPDQGRQAGDGAWRDAAARAALHAVVEADRRGTGAAVFARELHHLLHADAAGARRPLRGIGFEHLFLERFVTEGVFRDVLMVYQGVGDYHGPHVD